MKLLTNKETQSKKWQMRFTELMESCKKVNSKKVMHTLRRCTEAPALEVAHLIKVKDLSHTCRLDLFLEVTETDNHKTHRKKDLRAQNKRLWTGISTLGFHRKLKKR